MDSMVILIGLMVIVIIGAFVVLDRRDRLVRRLSERHQAEHGEPGRNEPEHHEPEHHEPERNEPERNVDQADARAAAKAAQMGRGGGWPAP